MDKIEKLTESDITAAIDAWKLYTLACGKITDRMNYIIRKCVEIAGGKLDWWDWNCDDDYEDRSSGDFMESYDKDTLTIRAEWSIKQEIIFLDKNGSEWGLWEGVPTRWLYEDFEKEFTNGLKAYKEKEIQKTAKKKEKKLKNVVDQKGLMEKVLSKLTKEERKVLGLK